MESTTNPSVWRGFRRGAVELVGLSRLSVNRYMQSNTGPKARTTASTTSRS